MRFCKQWMPGTLLWRPVRIGEMSLTDKLKKLA